MKDKIKKLFTSNSYVNDKIYRIAGNRRRKLLEEKNKILGRQDYLESIDDLKCFRKAVSDDKEIFFTYDANWSNAHIYGIWDSMFGNFSQYKICEMPSVEHGLILYDDIFTDVRYTGRKTVCTFSDFRKDIIQKYRNIPVFTVGPYINYAKDFYDQDKLLELKKKFGRTLLVFPTHSTDACSITVNQQKFINMLENEAKGFDTVLINTFWWNINDPLTQKLESEGYKIISCGFRDDTSFLPRLKSYINLADQVIGDSVGTHIGYCIALNKPFRYFNLNTEMNINESESNKLDFVTKNSNKIKESFLDSTSIGQKEIEICDYYWGNNIKRTELELKSIAEMSVELTRNKHGYSYKSLSDYQKLLDKYKAEDEIKYKLLKQAIKS